MSVRTKSSGPVVLLTDFGEQDAYAGILKGVIATINPDARIIDLSHSIEPQNIRQAAFVLFCAYHYFPEHTVFCVVIDPGVGSDRKAISITTRSYTFVGPDNGVLWEAARADGIQQIISLDNKAYFLEQVSHTFHGRDIFAPVCAHITRGMQDSGLLGPRLKTCTRYEFEQLPASGRVLKLSVLHIDRFGNIALNLSRERFEKMTRSNGFAVTAGKKVITRYYPVYDAAPEGELFLIGGSHPFMEISLKNGSAAQKVQVSATDTLVCEFFKT
jgi:S-adenosylmethionine hydrolase